MKTITSDYKDEIKKLGRQFDVKITYESNSETIELGKENFNSITPHYEGGILKSVMKQLDIDSRIDIPLNTELNYQFGIKVDRYNITEDETYQNNKNYYVLEDNEYILLVIGTDYQVGDTITSNIYEYEEYEYINNGNYIVYSSEKQEDIKSWKIICYDKMLYSMKDYEKMNITYPITIKNYINAICNHLGLTFKNIEDAFVNDSKEIQAELYLDAQDNSIGYTFRDVLDELAQVTASTICINEEDSKLEIRYISETDDIIDEKYLKDINVNFGEKYGPVNSIVLSRGAESDNVYLRDEDSVLENGLCELKIKDNQIMNFNDRSTYLPAILTQLDGLEYYLNDYISTGITYYELCDRYSITIGNKTYSCIMFNDEINITQGLKETIYTEIPEESETDYSKADKTDRRINQTYLIVDKQNQVIQSVVNNVTEQNNKISQINQTVDEINAKISDIADVTISGETNFANLTLDNINASEPLTIKIHAINPQNNISFLYPSSNLYPNSSLYPKSRILRFIRTYYESGETYTENIDYEIPGDLLYYNDNVYDEFYLNYESQTCQITKKCGYNADGSVYVLQQPEIITYSYPTITLGDGNYEIKLLGYEYGYLYAQLMASNIYTEQFATKVEMNSAISQTAEEINLEVSKKVDQNEVVSTINQSAEQITITGNRFVVNSTNFKLTANGTLNCNNAELTGSFSNYSSNGKLAVKISGTRIKLYDYDGNENVTGVLASTKGTQSGKIGVNLYTILGNRIALGYKDSEDDTTIHSIISYDTSDLDATPWIKNTKSGTLFPDNPNGGIIVEHGLIKNWDLTSVGGTFYLAGAQGQPDIGLVIENGLIVDFEIL